MASMKAKVLYDFDAQNPDELTIRAGDVLNIVQQGVGSGWWKARNRHGQIGLVPESYCEITDVPEPSIPVPPPPKQPMLPVSQVSVAKSFNDNDYLHPTPVVMRTAQPHPVQSMSSQPPAATRPPIFNPPTKPAQQNNDFDDDDDDDWDDDDDDDGYTKPTSQPANARASRTDSVSIGGDSQRYNTVNKKFRFSQFAKAGSEAFILSSGSEDVPAGITKITLQETPNGPKWPKLNPPFTCEISEPRKENKYHGMKSFIAYKVKPSFSGIIVTRRYKQFDWLLERLTAKYTMIAIPALPDKQIAGRFDEEFVQERMRWLQLWIDRLCQHPIIANSEVLQHFLTCTDIKAWKAGKRASEKDNYQGFRFFFTVQSPSHAQDQAQVEAKMEKHSLYIRSMEASIRNFLAIGDSNRKKHEGPFMKEFHKLGDAFNSLAQSFEFDEKQSARNINRALSATGQAYQTIGQLFSEQPKKDMNVVLEGLWEYKGIIATLPGVVSLHGAAVAKLQENSSKLTPSETSTAMRNIDVVANCVMAEMNYIQENQVSDFTKYMRTYLQGQINFYKTVTSRLEEALHEFNNI